MHSPVTNVGGGYRSSRKLPKLYLIQPRFPPSFWGMDYCRDLSGYSANFPPLGLMTLASLTPKGIDVRICDEHIEAADLYPKEDVVGITGYLLQRERVFELASWYKSMGKLVIIGGPIASLTPEECRPFCHVLFEGESEYTWPKFIEDLCSGVPQEHYRELGRVDLKDSPPPRIDLIKPECYAQGIVQTTRGCPFNCEFCDITVMFGRAVRTKPLSLVMHEIQLWYEAGMTNIFFADDNFAGNRKHARQLLLEIIEFNRTLTHPLSFHAQISVDITNDPDFLKLMQQANFHAVFVGIETPRKESLIETNKLQNAKLDLLQAVRTFQFHGLFVFAGMIVGFDHDDKMIFEEIYDFVQVAGIPLAMVGLLQALPKTALHKRLSATGRIMSQHQAGNNTAASSNIVPLKMAYQSMCDDYSLLCRKLYSYSAFKSRLMVSIKQFKNYSHQAQPITFKSLCAGLRVIRHYLVNSSFEGKRFFVSSMLQTLIRQPQALVPVMWYLGMYKHLRTFAVNDL